MKDPACKKVERNEFGHGALHKAVILNNTEEITRLIADGYDETIIDSSGFTATELAIILEKEWLLPYLDGSIYHDEEIVCRNFSNRRAAIKEKLKKRRSSVPKQRKKSWNFNIANKQCQVKKISFSNKRDIPSLNTNQNSSSNKPSLNHDTTNLTSYAPEHISTNHVVELNSSPETRDLKEGLEELNANKVVKHPSLSYSQMEDFLCLSKSENYNTYFENISGENNEYLKEDENDSMLQSCSSNENHLVCGNHSSDITNPKQNKALAVTASNGSKNDIVPPLLLPLATNVSYSNNPDMYSDSGFSTLRSSDGDINNNTMTINDYANMSETYENTRKEIDDDKTDDYFIHSYGIEQWIVNKGSYVDLNFNEEFEERVMAEEIAKLKDSTHIVHLLRDNPQSAEQYIKTTNADNNKVGYINIACSEADCFYSKDHSQIHAIHEKCQSHNINKDRDYCDGFVKPFLNEKHLRRYTNKEKHSCVLEVSATTRFDKEFKDDEDIKDLFSCENLSDNKIFNFSILFDLKRAHSWPLINMENSFVEMNEKIDQTNQEDWEVWDVEGDEKVDENLSNENITEKSLRFNTSINTTNELNSTNQDEVAYTYTAPSPKNTSNNNTFNGNLTVPLTQPKARSQSTSNNLKPHRSKSSEDTRGLSSSFTLGVPDMKKSRSSTAIPNGESKTDSKGFSKSVQYEPQKEKKRRSFLSLFGMKKSTSSSEISKLNRSRNSSTSSDDPRGFNRSIDPNSGEEKHTLIVPTLKRSESSSSITSNGNECINQDGLGFSSSMKLNSTSGSNTSVHKLSLGELNAARPDSGYFSPDELKKTSTPKKNSKMSYSITFTPETSIEQKNNNSTSNTSTPFFPLQVPLLPLLGVGLGEEQPTHDALHNVLSPHTVKEHGFFSLGGNQIIDVDTKKTSSDNSVEKNSNVNSKTESNMDNVSSDQGKDTSEDNSPSVTIEVQDTIEDTSHFSDNDEDFKEAAKPRGIIPVKLRDDEEFCEVLDTDYDYPNHSTPNKDLVSTDSTKTRIEADDSNIMSTPTTDKHTAHEDSQDGKEVPAVRQLILDDDGFFTPGFQQGSANGQLPKYEDLYAVTDSPNDKESSASVVQQNIIHSEVSDELNSENTTGVFPVFEHTNQVDDSTAEESVKSSGSDDEDNNKPSFVEDAFEFDSSHLEDSMASFEKHEEEYSRNNQMPRWKEELSADEEDDNLYRDYNDEHVERKLTMELLNYMPPIIERSVELHEVIQEEKVEQSVSDEGIDQTDLQRVIISSQEHSNKKNTEDPLDDFVNIIIEEKEEELQGEDSVHSFDKASVKDEQEKVHEIYIKHGDDAIVNNVPTPAEKSSLDDPGKKIVKESETSKPHNTIVFEFSLPQEDSTAPLATTTKVEDKPVETARLIHDDTTVSSTRPITPPIEDGEEKTTSKKRDEAEPMYFSNEFKPITNEIRSYEKKSDCLKNFDENSSTYPVLEQKKCLWYDYELDGEFTNKNERSKSPAVLNEAETVSPVISRKDEDQIDEEKDENSFRLDAQKRNDSYLKLTPDIDELCSDEEKEMENEFDVNTNKAKPATSEDEKNINEEIIATVINNTEEEKTCDENKVNEYEADENETKYTIEVTKENKNDDKKMRDEYDSDGNEEEEFDNDYVIREIKESDTENENVNVNDEEKYSLEIDSDEENVVRDSEEDDDDFVNIEYEIKEANEENDEVKCKIDNQGVEPTKESNEECDHNDEKVDNLDEIKYLVAALDEHYKLISSDTINENVKKLKRRAKKKRALKRIKSDEPILYKRIDCDAVDCNVLPVSDAENKRTRDDKIRVEEEEIEEDKLEFDLYEMDLTILLNDSFDAEYSGDVPDQELSISKKIYSRKKKRLQVQRTEDFTVISDDECSILEDYTSPRSSTIPVKDIEVGNNAEKKKPLLSEDYTVISFDERGEKKDQAPKKDDQDDESLSETFGADFNLTSSLNDRATTPVSFSRGVRRPGSLHGRVSSPKLFSKALSADEGTLKNIEMRDAKDIKSKSRPSDVKRHSLPIMLKSNEELRNDRISTDDEDEPSLSEKYGQEFNLTSSYNERSNTPVSSNKGVSRSGSFSERGASPNIFSKKQTSEDDNVKTIELKDAKELITKSNLFDTSRGGSPAHISTGKNLEREDAIEINDDDADSGMGLASDDFSLSVSTERLNVPEEPAEDKFDYMRWIETIEPNLHDPKLVADLYLYLSSKYLNKNGRAYDLKRIRMGKMVYWIIHDKQYCNFVSVITYLLSFMDVIKSEDKGVQNVNIEELLIYLTDLITESKMKAEHIKFFAYFLSRPNTSLTPYHRLRVCFLHACFKEEIAQIKHLGTLDHLTTSFIKISEYFIQVDNQLASKLTEEYLIPYTLQPYYADLINNILKYMGLLKAEKDIPIADDVTSSLVLLKILLNRLNFPKDDIATLRSLLKKDDIKFQFCRRGQQELISEL
ncbi:uncharacterized protein LOC130654190 isoform X2 [Hydractinia symbiolongicarpus]|uniref:uncharacterized protein LOC130654190 isoform X2 n=1 Tax=Hydractinia symbiolongicarpus TaxID=13093 RepID=UPI00254B8ADE|nr:uncharacterized protein LOC130654190 isoform X2 [Hydractinia symbiolongicarpus]